MQADTSSSGTKSVKTVVTSEFVLLQPSFFTPPDLNHSWFFIPSFFLESQAVSRSAYHI
jgi:hypothetical protein